MAKQRIRAQQLTKQVGFQFLLKFSIFWILNSSNVMLVQVADWRRMSAAVAATHPGPGDHHALACRPSRRDAGDGQQLSPPHQYNRSLSMDRLKQEVRKYFKMDQRVTLSLSAGAASSDRQVRRRQVREESKGGAKVEGGLSPQEGGRGGGAGAGRQQQRGRGAWQQPSSEP